MASVSKTHLTCPECGGHDCYTEYDDDSAYCFQCGFTIKSADFVPHSANTQPLIVEPYEMPALTVQAIKSRKLSAETCSRFGIGRNGNTLYFPYYVNGVVAGAKLRLGGVPKEQSFRWEGAKENKEAVTFFGLQACSSKFSLILLEGEFDVPSAYQMLKDQGKEYSCVSVPFGTKSAAKYIKRALPWVESFEKVFVCMDMDKPGREASNEIMSLLKPGKGYEVILPEGFKDASDMLVAGKGREFLSAIYAAQPRKIPGIVAVNEMVERTLDWYFTREKRFGIPTGWDGLNKFIGGYRAGEMYGLVAGVGIGKSTFARNILYNVHLQGHKSMLFSLEDMNEAANIHFAGMAMGESIMQSDEFDDRTRLRNALTPVLENIRLYDHTGVLDIPTFETVVEYAVRMDDVKLVLLDNITVMAEGGDQSVLESIQQAMAKFRLLARRLEITIIVICHMKQGTSSADEDVPTLHRIKGSSSIKQACDCILGVSRQRDSNVMSMTTLKGNRTWGGQFGKLELVYDPATGRINEADCVAFDGQPPALEDWIEQNIEGTGNDDTETSETTEVQEQFRSGDIQREQAVSKGVRNEEVPGSTALQVHAGHHADKPADGRAESHRTQRTVGVLQTRGQTEVGGVHQAAPAHPDVHPVPEHMEDRENHQRPVGTQARGNRRPSRKPYFQDSE